MAQIETNSAEPAPAASPLGRGPSIEDRITAALVPPPPPQETSDEASDEAARQDPERSGSEPTETVPAQADAGDGQPQDGGEDGDAQPAQETIELGSLADLAKHIDVDVGDLYEITIPIDVDGKEPVELSLGEWKDRLKGGLEAEQIQQQRKQFAEEREAAEARLASQRRQVEQSIADAARLTEVAEQRLLADLEGIDWAKLRGDDPAEWAAKQQEVQQRQAQIKEAKQELAAKWTAHTETLRTDAEEQFKENLRREHESLLKAIPDWRDTGKYESERKALAEYLSGQGFTEEEIANAADHRLIVMARKAQMYDERSSKSSVAKKKVARASKKVVKPGASAGKETARQDTEAQLRTRLRKSGRMDDAAALIAARLRR